MFTGIIEEIGKVIYRGLSSIEIEVHKISDDIRIGDSIAVNGVCLTVTEYKGNTVTFDVMNETLKKTDLGLLKAGSRVNLERAMPANGRFGGHIVSGHTDGTGRIINITNDGIAVWYTISVPGNILKGIVIKGSVALDGISLTVADMGNNFFKVSVIPHTRSATALSDKKIGDSINIETDIIGKYVERLFYLKAQKNVLDMDHLIENGF